MKRKWNLIDDLMYSSSNLTTVKEENEQLNDQFKALVSLHKEYPDLLPQEVVTEEHDWFETINEVVFIHTHKIYNWIKEVEDDNKSRSSRSSAKKSSRTSTKKSRTKFFKNQVIKKLPWKNISERESTERGTKKWQSYWQKPHSQKKSMLSFAMLRS